MAGHGAIKRQGNGATIYTQETGRTVLRGFKANIEAQSIDVELLGNAEIVCGQNRYSFLHLRGSGVEAERKGSATRARSANLTRNSTRQPRPDGRRAERDRARRLSRQS